MAGALLVVAALYLYANRPAPASAFAWGTNLEAGLRRAAESRQLVFVKFHATWCGPCKAMDRDVFSREDVAKALANWVPVSIDVDEQLSVSRQYKISSVPTLLVLNSRGEVLSRQMGTMPPEDFIAWLGQVEAKVK
jgi:thiol:disulfide interchange protein